VDEPHDPIRRRPNTPAQKAAALLSAAVGIPLLVFSCQERAERREEADDRMISSLDASARAGEDEVLGAIGGVPAPPTGAELVQQSSMRGPEGLPLLSWRYRVDLTGAQIARHYRAVLVPDGWVELEADALARFQRTVDGQRYVIVVRVAEASTFEVEVRAPGSWLRSSIAHGEQELRHSLLRPFSAVDENGGDPTR
jgi:hypothetical protein